MALVRQHRRARPDELVDLQRDLHAHPELSRGEVRTTRRVAAAAGRGRARRTAPCPAPAWSPTSAPSSRRPGRRCGPTSTRCPSGSAPACPAPRRTEGVCHACGHDVHTAAVLGAGLALGARRPCASAASGGPAALPAGRGGHPRRRARRASRPAARSTASTRSSRCTATRASTSARVGPARGRHHRGRRPGQVHLTGRGGHTSRPHLTEDLVFALAKVVTELPAALSRRLDPRAALSAGLGPGARRRPPTPSRRRRGRGHPALLDASLDTTARSSPSAVEHVVAPYGVTRRRRARPGSAAGGQRPGGHSRCCRPRPRVPGGPVGTTAEPRRRGLRLVPGPGARGAGPAGHPDAGGRTYDLHQGDLVVDEGSVVRARGCSRVLWCRVSSDACAPLRRLDETPSRLGNGL